MQIRTDFHLHTTLSVDATTQPEELIERSMALGMQEIAITDHVDNNSADEGAGRYDPHKAYELTQRLNTRFGDRITIRHGVELGEPHLYADENAIIYNLPVDIVIGSVHYIGTRGMHGDFFDAFGAAEGIARYFDFMLEMVKSADMDVLGHLDYFERYTAQRGLQAYEPNRFRDRIEPILEVIISRNIALEVNTSGYRADLGRPFPHLTVLEWYRRRGGTLISLASDAHHVQHIGAGLDRAADCLKSLGFGEYHVYSRRKSRAIRLSNV